MTTPARRAVLLSPVSAATRIWWLTYRLAGKALVAFATVFSAAAVYFAATQLYAPETAAWHRLVPNPFVRNIIFRDAMLEVVPALFVAAGVYFTAKQASKIRPWQRALVGWSFPRLVLCSLLAFVMCAPGFFAFIGLTDLWNANYWQHIHPLMIQVLPWVHAHTGGAALHSQATSSRLAKLEALFTKDGLKKLAVVAGTLFFGFMFIRPVLDNIQLWHAEEMYQRDPSGGAVRWWHPGGLARRYRELVIAGSAIPDSHLRSHSGWHRLAGRVLLAFLILTIPVGVYIIEFYAPAVQAAHALAG